MFFYQIKATMKDTEHSDLIGVGNLKKYDEICDITDITEEFNRELNEDSYIFISSKKKSDLQLGVIAKNNIKVCKLAERFLKRTELKTEIKDIREITMEAIFELLERGKRHDYVDDDIEEKFKIGSLKNSIMHFGENIIPEKSKDIIYKDVENYLMKDAMLEELERIYQKSKSKMPGHPVHYMICTDNGDIRREVPKLLLSALYDVKRIKSRRYCFINTCIGASAHQRFNLYELDELYQTCADGAIVIRIEMSLSDNEDEAGMEHLIVEKITECMKKYRHSVLTLLCLKKTSEHMKALLYEKLGSIRLVELCEDLAEGETAKNYLKHFALKYNVESDKNLLSMIDDKVSYSAQELQKIFDEWYDDKINLYTYPQYSSFAAANTEVLKEKEKGTAYEKLQKMIGLTEAKKVIDNALNYFKFQKLYKDEIGTNKRPSMHMVFTGNPGTAKTSVARLVAAIFRENGILSSGHLVEVGRSELVGAYVGWTAQTVKKKFEDAEGGILFIDEAYSLVDDRKGSFGDEAINTIVQEMENHRDDVIVILAGYKEEMEHFLETNPGLRSRIAFHVPFEDYNADELTEIAQLMAEDQKVLLTPDALSKIHSITEIACKSSAFGNGRYVRNLMERAYMSQASRIIGMGEIKTSKKFLTTLEAEDFEPITTGQEVKNSIGFAGNWV